jgi:hypothetical protein
MAKASMKKARPPRAHVFDVLNKEGLSTRLHHQEAMESAAPPYSVENREH